MTIRNLSRFTNSLWDWGTLNDCFGYGCKVSDLDGEVERRGEFLIIEGKGPDVRISAGLAKKLNRYLELGHHAPLILWGESGRYRDCCLYCGNPTTFDKEPPAPTQMQLWPLDPIACDLNLVREFAHDWFRWADDRPVPLISGARQRPATNTEVLRWMEEWQKRRVR